ncbi:38026_t:CDS:2, partial [Gigaspora margarita]
PFCSVRSSMWWLTLSKGTIEYESKLFDKIILGFTRLLYITPEKLLLNKSVWRLCNHLYDIRKLQFVIDKAHSWADEIVNLVKNIEKPGHTIIYCAQISDCLDVFNTLSTKLEELSLDIYNGQLTESDKNNAIKKWNKGQTHLIIAILAFGLGDPVPQSCNFCDNCAMCIEDKVKIKDVKTEILDLLKVVEVLCENNNKPIVLLD